MARFILAKGILSSQIKTALFQVEGIENDTSDITSYLGTPVFGSIEFRGGSYEDLEGNVKTFDGLRINNCITTVEYIKNIIRTQLNNRKGSVKEYIGDGDYNISLELEISNADNRYPSDDVSKFINIAEVPNRVEVVNELLQLFGINYIVIENVIAGQERGFRGRQKFLVRAYSDFDELIEE